MSYKISLEELVSTRLCFENSSDEISTLICRDPHYQSKFKGFIIVIEDYSEVSILRQKDIKSNPIILNKLFYLKREEIHKLSLINFKLKSDGDLMDKLILLSYNLHSGY